MGKETNKVLLAVALVTCLAAYAQMHYGVMQKFHGEGGMRHDLHTSRHKDHLWDGFHRDDGHASPSCPPCDDACGGEGRGHGDAGSDAVGDGSRASQSLPHHRGDGDGDGADAGTRGKRPSSSKKGSFDISGLTPGLAAEAKDLDTIALKEELRTAKERIGELTALINNKCVVKDFTQCASACSHRIMRHKQFLAQCHKTLQHRGCPDPVLQTARVLAKGRGRREGTQCPRNKTTLSRRS